MTTYSKETALYDTGAIKTDVDEAATKATNYLSADSSGIMVYDGSNGIQAPSTVSSGTNNVFIDPDSLDIRDGTDVLATFGTEVAIGKEDSAQLRISEGLIEGTGEDGLPYFSVDNRGATDTTTSYTYLKNYGPYSVTRSSSRTVSIATTMSLLPSTGDFAIGGYKTSSGTWDGSNNAQSSRLIFTRGTSQTFFFTNSNLSHISITYDGNQSITIKSTKTPTTYVYITTWQVSSVTKSTPVYVFGAQEQTETEVDYGQYAFLSGYECKAPGKYSHAEGYKTKASGNYSHAEGYETKAIDSVSHAEGLETEARGSYSHAQNKGTFAAREAQTAIGTYNEEDTASTTTHPSGLVNYGEYAFIIGNGTSSDAANRSNAFAVDWLGNVNAAGTFFGSFKIPCARWTGTTTSNLSGTTGTEYNFNQFTGHSASIATNDNDIFEVDPNGMKVKKTGWYLFTGNVHMNSAGNGNMMRCTLYDYDAQANFASPNYAYQNSGFSSHNSTIVAYVSAGDRIIYHFCRYSGTQAFRPTSTYINAVMLAPYTE